MTKSNELWIVAIVGIVAVFGIVAIVNSVNSAASLEATQTGATALSPSLGDQPQNLVGEAYRYGRQSMQEVEVTFLVTDGSQAKFLVNGEVTATMREGDEYELSSTRWGGTAIYLSQLIPVSAYRPGSEATTVAEICISSMGRCAVLDTLALSETNTYEIPYRFGEPRIDEFGRDALDRDVPNTRGFD